MIDILSSSQLLLRDAGFSTRLRNVDGAQTICFEDEALIGFCSVFETVGELVTGWRSRELSTLRQFAPSLQGAGDKAWNVYFAFLSGDAPEADQVRQVRWIEEDLERTRKIAACGIGSREDIVKAFLPVLPLQHQPQLQMEDATERLKKRIASVAPKAADAALDPDIAVGEVIRLIGEAL